MMQTNHSEPRKRWTSLTTVAARENSSSLDAMAIHSITPGGAMAPIQEEKA
jgi:hypothetical protein